MGVGASEGWYTRHARQLDLSKEPLPLQEAQVGVQAAEGWYTRHARQHNVSIHDIIEVMRPLPIQGGTGGCTCRTAHVHDIIDNWAGIHDITDNRT